MATKKNNKIKKNIKTTKVNTTKKKVALDETKKDSVKKDKDIELNILEDTSLNNKEPDALTFIDFCYNSVYDDEIVPISDDTKVLYEKEEKDITPVTEDTMVSFKPLDTGIVPIRTEEEENEEDIKLDIPKKKKREVNNEDDDIYLTSSFKPIKNQINVKSIFSLGLKIIVVIGAIMGLTMYVIKPIIVKLSTPKPNYVFSETMDGINNKIVSFINEFYDFHDKLNLNSNINIQTNLSEYKELNNNKYGIDFNINNAENVTKEFIYTLVNDKKMGLNIIRKNDLNYINFTDSNRYLEDVKRYDRAESSLSNTLYDYIKYFSGLPKEDILYIFNEFSVIIDTTIETEKDLIEQEKDNLEIADRSYKVVRNSFSMDSSDLARIKARNIDLILKNNKLIISLSKAFNTTPSKTREYLIELKDKEIKLQDELVFNIYVLDGKTVVGIDMEKDGFRDFYYYFDNQGFNLHFNVNNLIKKLKNKIIDIDGTYKNNKTNMIINCNSKKVLELSLSKDKDNEYTINYKKENLKQQVTGDFTLKKKNDAYVYTFDLIQIDGESYLTLQSDGKLSKGIDSIFIDEDYVRSFTNRYYKKELDLFYNNVNDKKLYDGFIKFNDIYNNKNFKILR